MRLSAPLFLPAIAVILPAAAAPTQAPRQGTESFPIAGWDGDFHYSSVTVDYGARTVTYNYDIGGGYTFHVDDANLFNALIASYRLRTQPAGRTPQR